METEIKKEQARINKEKVKQYKRQLKSEIFDLDNELSFTEEGEAEINCYIGSAEKIFSEFDIAKDRTINDRFHRYLLDETEIIPIRYNLQLNMFVNNDFTKENELQVTRAIKRHFSFNITTDIVKTSKTNLRCFLLLFLGFICLTLIPVISTIQIKFPLYETFLVLTWFFLWEGVGTKLFEGSAIKTHKYNMLRLYNAKVVFIKTKDKDVAVQHKTILKQENGKEKAL